ncbi:putative oxidase assembly protein [Cavenderia fasciculata]|uniref:Oxidase assembly protein n=1 Tax=Cavenderia fasciculata TaxID=261658 RepID=F4PST3_CACFS|nr:putative oxidase assembly protein [Cavenderia fasciculata]EGG21561.1 putative oxidase assembly protein [Cavenderia fasciculata]|eukprot:XP_004359411.1 putative oxidase assembly protein [Cavenderia fasciculata]
MIGSRALRRTLVSSINKSSSASFAVGNNNNVFRYNLLNGTTSSSSSSSMMMNNNNVGSIIGQSFINRNSRFYSTDNNKNEIVYDTTTTVPQQTIQLTNAQEKAIETVVNSTSDVSVGSIISQPSTTTTTTQIIYDTPQNPIIEAVSNFNTGIVESINNFSISSGCPWWLCIAGMTVGLRFLILPLTVKQQRSAAAMALVKEEMEKHSYLNDGTTEGKMKLFTLQREISVKHGVSPMKLLFVGLAQAPAYIYLFYIIRSACVDFPQFVTNGGLLWFPNLSIVDPYVYALPIISSLFQWTSMRLSFTETTPLIMKIVFGGLCILPLYFTLDFPAGLNLYWCINSLLFVVQNYIFKKPAVKRFFNIPIHGKPTTGAGSAMEIRTAPEVIKKVAPESIFPEDKAMRLEKLKLEVKEKKKDALGRRK